MKAKKARTLYSTYNFWAKLYGQSILITTTGQKLQQLTAFHFEVPWDAFKGTRQEIRCVPWGRQTAEDIILIVAGTCPTCTDCGARGGRLLAVPRGASGGHCHH